MVKTLPLLESPAAVACCAPLASAPLSVDDAKVLAAQLKAIADPARLRLLSLMLANEDLEACTCDLTDELGLSQPTVSHHMKCLVSAGLVRAQKRGRWTYYVLEPSALEDLRSLLARLGSSAASPPPPAQTPPRRSASCAEAHPQGG